MKKYILTFAFILPLFMLSGCGIYSFSGASIPAEAKTLSVIYFPNKAPIVQPMLSKNITEALQDKFRSETRLSIIQRNGDLAIEGEITGYDTQPIAIQGNQIAALNRFTLTVNVRFRNKFDEKSNFESSFSRYRDYSSSKSLSAVEQDLLPGMLEELVQDIFNKCVVNWN
ncbi:MAG: LptE family protein [Bacteroidetes bacterium]|nr:LptE family protein [Bacteroidota bacterium]